MKLFNLPKFWGAATNSPATTVAANARASAQPAVVSENVAVFTDPLLRIEKSGYFRVDDIELIAKTYDALGNTPGTVWDQLRGKCLALPEWFEQGLPPLSIAYSEQQMRLWKIISGIDREYSPALDEALEPIADVDAVRRPSYYIRRNRDAVKDASDHLFATAMVFKHCGLEPGMWALEYGAGFAQTALALARMGVNVDTVDISPTFCGYVKAQADFYQVNLTPFNALFGDNPRGEQKYDLIWFYESFHHCVDFRNVVGELKHHLTPTGKILLAGEPIGKREYLAVPYPWGLRLESEVIAVIRNLHWFELGFSEDFICNFFVNNGYTAECIECPMSIYGLLYSFAPRTAGIDLSTHWLPCVDAEGWHAAEPDGRWTRQIASLALDQGDSFDTLEVAASNCFHESRVVEIAYGSETATVNFAAGERKVFYITARDKSPKLTFKCETFLPQHTNPASSDTRALGIFIHRIDYVSRAIGD